MGFGETLGYITVSIVHAIEEAFGTGRERPGDEQVLRGLRSVASAKTVNKLLRGPERRLMGLGCGFLKLEPRTKFRVQIF